jgi:hypothetical protein
MEHVKNTFEDANNTHEAHLTYALEQGMDLVRNLVELTAMLSQADREGKQIPASVKETLKKFAPLAQNEKILLGIKTDLGKAKSDMFNLGIKITAEDVTRIIEEDAHINEFLHKELGSLDSN